MMWIELESFWLGSPAFADELVWCEAFECLEPTSKIIGVHEVAQMIPTAIRIDPHEPIPASRLI